MSIPIQQRMLLPLHASDNDLHCGVEFSDIPDHLRIKIDINVQNRACESFKGVSGSKGKYKTGSINMHS